MQHDIDAAAARIDRLERELRSERQRGEDMEAAAAQLLEEVVKLRELVAAHDREAQDRASARRRTVESQQRLRARIVLLEDRIREIEDSAGWRVARQAYRLRDLVVPPGSPRRGMYERLTRRSERAPAHLPEPVPDAAPDWEVVGALGFAQPSRPVASIVVPVHDMAGFTVRCLQSIADDPTSVPFEVIVVDDASNDSTRAVLSRIDGVRAIHNPEQIGFVGSCNRGIGAAKGEYVVLLNNDTEVRHGWLDALVATADSDPEVGVIGSKLVYPDGRLQEAGGIVWNDGSAWNYGRTDDPHLSTYDYAREVDYCSGACLLVRRELLTELGGLDERYAPAYYEDTDLAFAARAKGYRVLYQPLSVVIHHEGVSHGTDARIGIKRYQELNREKFAEKWRDDLVRQRDPESRELALARDRRPGPRVLIADHYVPRPDQDSGSLRMNRILDLLKDLGCVVTLLPHNGEGPEPYTTLLEQRGIEVLHGGVDVESHLRALAPGLALCILSRPPVAEDLLPVIRANAPGAIVVYDTVDLHFLRRDRQAALGVAPDDAPVIDELALVRATDASIAISPEERDILRELVPGATVFEVPNVHTVDEPTVELADRRDLVFVGGFQHSPNVDAMVHFVREVLPRIREQLPDVGLTIVGSNPPPEVEALAEAQVRVLGWVPDLTEIYRSHRVAVAPLRYGAGLKGKVGESLSHGVPTVTTPVGAEGFGAEHRRHLLVGEVPDEFAALVVELYTDAGLWTKLSVEGRHLIEERFSPAAARRALERMLSQLGVETPPAEG